MGRNEAVRKEGNKQWECDVRESRIARSFRRNRGVNNSRFLTF